MKSIDMLIRAVFLSALLLASVSLPAQQQPSEHRHQHQHGGQAAGDRSEAQQQAISHMHHELEEDQAPWKEREARALKELNEMTIRDDVELDAVYAKIDELMEAKNHIMRLRYQHLIEMREILTEEQRVEYDKRVLKRSAVR